MKPNSIPSAGAAADSSTNAQVTTSSHNSSKPHVGCCTSVETAMQKLKWFVSDGLNNFDESVKVSEIWDEINKLLEIEKRQIRDAFDDGQANWDAKCQDYKDGNEYFNNIFKS
jgi:hypothetical protein